MKNKHVDLLNCLMEHDSTMTCKELANLLYISPRSIKNYVNEINLLSNFKVIISGKNGYTVQRSAANELLSNKDNSIPQTSEERIFYMIKQIMLEHTQHLDIYDLSEKLFVGYSTIKADIAKMNKAFANFHVEFTCEGEEVRIHGSEKNMRKLVSYVMYEETDKQFMDASIIEKCFSNFSIDKVSNIIQTTFKKYHYYINDFSFINMLLHFAIIIDRIKEGNYVEAEKEDFIIESEVERQLVFELCEYLEKEFRITFNKNEQFEIYMLFKTNANYSMPSSKENLKKLVGDEIFNLIINIIAKVNEDYYIDLNHESFITPFSLHVKNLILRVKNDTYTKNPMVEVIKHSCPTVYDIAIYISLELMRNYHIEINEDEVTFLALHIGAEIERQKTNDSKIQCVLLCPDYMKMTTMVYNRLLMDFGNQINITNTISYESELSMLKYDMIITTIKIQKNVNREVCLIPPFSGHMNLAILQNTIDRYRSNQKNYILKKNFHSFFYDQLFIANPKEVERDEIIPLLAGKMVSLEYVNEDFEKNVMIREDAASTAFINIAIPHSMEMEALKTCIGVAISQKGIIWDQHLVHVVLLVAINKVDKQIFHDLYEALVVLFSENKLIEGAKNCINFEDFENLIYSNITFQEDKK